jgi:hypothetical protein
MVARPKSVIATSLLHSPAPGTPVGAGAISSGIGDPRMSYSRQFFEGQRSGSLESAKIAVPILMDLVAPRSVLDIGCGVGT